MQKQTLKVPLASLFLKIIPWFTIIGLLACQLSSLLPSSTPTTSPTRAPTATKTLIPTPPIAQSAFPTQPPAPTDTPAPVVAQISENLRVRSSPSTSGAIVDRLQPGDKIQVLGKTAAGDWLQIPLPSNPNARGWISAAYAQLSGSADTLPVVQPGSAPIPPTRRPYP